MTFLIPAGISLGTSLLSGLFGKKKSSVSGRLNDIDSTVYNALTGKVPISAEGLSAEEKLVYQGKINKLMKDIFGTTSDEYRTLAGKGILRSGAAVTAVEQAGAKAGEQGTSALNELTLIDQDLKRKNKQDTMNNLFNYMDILNRRDTNENAQPGVGDFLGQAGKNVSDYYTLFNMFGKTK
jgi:hypothetical protein